MIDLKKKFLIYGYGISGKSIEKYLNYKNCIYDIYDDYQKINHKNIISKKYLLKKINEYSYFVVSPSIKIEKKHFLFRYKNKIIIDLDFLSLEITSQKIIGVTGTEGKSSTCCHLQEILSKKYNTKIIGNFGSTILDKKNISNYLSKIDILIIELSSYQLDKVKFLKLHYGLITNIYIDHLDYHKNVKNYIRSKFRIQDLLYKNSNLFLTKKLYLNYQRFLKINTNRLIFNKDVIPSKKEINSYIKDLNFNNIKKLIENFDSKIKINNIKITKELKFRNQLIYNSHNLKLYNDSKCTNLDNAIYKNKLIRSSKKILILGGQLKRYDKKVKFDVTNTLVLIFGNNNNLFLNHLNFINSNYYKFNNLNDSINFLKLIIKLRKYSHILFSPGGESYDSYNNYLERGKHFNQLIKKVLI